MPKIQNVGLGNYIRNPKNRKEVLRVDTNNGNSFTCYPVKAVHSTRVVVDTERYEQIPLDREVEQITI